MTNKPARVTLRDISRACGFSVNTVSRALRGDLRLSEETRNRICAAAEEMGYIRNSLASGLRSGKSHVIAIIVEEIQNPHYSSLLGELDLLLRKNGYIPMILCTHNDADQEVAMLELAVSHSVDGIFLFPLSSGSRAASRIKSSHLPLVLIDREISGVRLDLVRIDDYDGGLQAGRYLIGAGHSRFLYIGGSVTNSSHTYRFQGFNDALKEAGFSADDCLRVISHRDIESDFAGRLRELLPSEIRGTGIFAFNDELAYYTVNELLTRGVRIPEDVHIVGFDDIRRTISYLPALTTIAGIPGASMAGSAVRLLLERIADPELPAREEIIPVVLRNAGEDR